MEKKKKRFNYIIVMLLAVLLFAGMMYAQTDKELFDRARLSLFDRKWDEALNDLNRITENFPKSNYYSQVLFYKGKCFEEKKMLQKALESYTAFLKVSVNATLNEEAMRAMIDLNYSLYESGGNASKYLDGIAAFLSGKSQIAQYYAAFKLSFVKNRAFTSRAVPVLKKIIAEEQDEELVDRAKITLMRIDPSLLKKTEPLKNLENRMLVLRIYDKKLKKDSFSFSIPFALARLALDSLPEDKKKVLNKKGFDADNILEAIAKTGNIFKFENEDTIIKIWIE
jgi:tetratricopeptide (TPR) repeat protein